MSLEVKVNVDTGDITDKFDRISENLQDTVNSVIYDYLEKIKDKGLEIRRWQNRTGTLEASHIIQATEDGGELIVNPYINPQNGKIVTADYAAILEYYMGYEWIGPAVDIVKDEMFDAIKKSVEDLIAKSGNVHQTIQMKGGKEYVIWRNELGQYASAPEG